MNRSIFVLVPSLVPTGPVKGAIALANALSAVRPTTLVGLRPGRGAEGPLAENLQCVELPGRNWRARRGDLKTRLAEAGGRGRVTLITYCLSADLTGLTLRKHASVLCSVRGNLPANYRFDYGWWGSGLAAAHLFLLRYANEIVAMSEGMSRQIARYAGRLPEIIPNFIDEAPIEPHRAPPEPSGQLRFVMLGSLTERKQPLVQINALAQLRDRGISARLDFVGDGPLRPQIEARIAELELQDCVTLHGQLSEPYPVVACAHALVAPSLSEGMSRAVLEALHLGVPCILRDVDGNREIVSDGSNGVLFCGDEELPDAMLSGAALRKEEPVSLLPRGMRQSRCAARYLDLAEREVQ